MSDDPAGPYAGLVLAGEIAVNKYVRAVCERHQLELARQGDSDFPFYFDAGAAARIIGFFQTKLCHGAGKFIGTPFEILPWQRFLLSTLYGWKQRENGERRFKVCYLESGKGSGKSPIVAGMLLYFLLADGRKNEEGGIFAASADQGSLLAKMAVDMGAASPTISPYFKFHGGQKPTRLFAEIAGTRVDRHAPNLKAAGKSGPTLAFAAIEEYHEHPYPIMKELAQASFKTSRSPLMFIGTNAGTDMASPCGQEHEYATKVALGKVRNDNYLALVYGQDEGDRPIEDEAVWEKSNPSIRAGLPSLDRLREQVEHVRAAPGARAVVLRLHFCDWSYSLSPWIDQETFESAVGELSPEEDRLNAPCWVGLDLGGGLDLSALAIVWDFGDRLEVEARAYMPEGRVQKMTDYDRRPYAQWAEEGYLTLTSGEGLEAEDIAKHLKEVWQHYEPLGLICDFYQIDRLKRALLDISMKATDDRWRPHDIWTIKHRMTASLPKATLLRKGQRSEDAPRFWVSDSLNLSENEFREGRIRVQNNPLLRAGMAAVEIKHDRNGNTFSKESYNSRIDPVAALVLGVACAVKMRGHITRRATGSLPIAPVWDEPLRPGLY